MTNENVNTYFLLSRASPLDPFLSFDLSFCIFGFNFCISILRPFASAQGDKWTLPLGSKPIIAAKSLKCQLF